MSNLNDDFLEKIRKMRIEAILKIEEEDRLYLHKKILEVAKQSFEVANKVFDGMDNGNFKPLAIKLFDLLEDKVKDVINPIESKKDNFNIFDKIIEQSKSLIQYDKDDNLITNVKDKITDLIPEKQVEKEEYKKVKRDRLR